MCICASSPVRNPRGAFITSSTPYEETHGITTRGGSSAIRTDHQAAAEHRMDRLDRHVSPGQQQGDLRVSMAAGRVKIHGARDGGGDAEPVISGGASEPAVPLRGE